MNIKILLEKLWKVLNKDLSAKKKHIRIFRFNTKKWLLFASLLENGYSIHHALTLMNVDCSLVNTYLQEGKKIEDIVLQGQKGAFYDHLGFFIQFMSISNAIYCSFQMHRFEKDSIANIKKKCSYPIFVLCISFISIFLFSKYIIPQLFLNFDSVEGNVFVFILKGIELSSVYFFCLTSLLILILLLSQKYTTVLNYLIVKIIPHVTLIKQYISYCLSGYMKSLHTQGLSSKLAFEYLSNLKTNKVLAYVINDMTKQLNTGEDLCEIVLHNPYLDNDFKMYFSVGYHNANSDESLHSYIKNVEIKWERYISCFSVGVQLIAYSFVAILLICVYQILLIPLEILEQL